MAVTIKDVGKETNLAISTISKYMNGGNVRPENRKIIEEAIKKLGYQPNKVAKGLRSAKTYTIGLVIESLENQFFSKIAMKIEQSLKQLGYSVILYCHKDNPQRAEKAVKFLMDKQVDGIIMTALDGDKDYTKEPSREHIPIIALDRVMGTGNCDCVMSNCATGVYNAIEYFIQKGHKEIGIITGVAEKNPGILTAKERLRGYLRAMEDYELPVSEEFILKGDFTFDSGILCMEALWKLDWHPTALFISNYNMCLGAITAIHNLKIKVPSELSVITFDDLEFSIISKPKLTAVGQPIEEIAEKAVALLLRRMEDDYLDFPRKIKLQTSFTERESVMNLNGQQRLQV